MKLFELDDSYNVNFNPELFLLDDFKQLKLSRKKNIDLLYKEISYVYYFADMSSDFQFQTDLKARKEDIKKYVKLDPKWEPDEKISKCIDTYNYLSQTISSKLLNSVYIAVDKIQVHLENIDLSERDKSNKPIFKQNDIISSIKQIPELLKAIRQAESEYIKNKETNDKLRGDKIKTLYEDGIRGIT